MKRVLIEPHYFGSLEYYSLLAQYDSLLVEVSQHYSKQTYKNRCELLTTQGVNALTIPVHYTNRTLLKDVKIDYTQRWVKVHLGLIKAAYGKSAFFDFFFPEIEDLLKKQNTFLCDLTLDAMQLVVKNLQLKIKIDLTDAYQEEANPTFFDARETILVKKSFKERHFYQEVRYFQNFGSSFVPNLSVLDCLMNTGPESSRIIKESIINQ